MINRLSDFDEGDILLDRVSVRDYDPLELRRSVGIVFQIPVMFEGNVMDNIIYGLKIHMEKGGGGERNGGEGKENCKRDGH